jgi:hypothetical protein
MKSPPVQYPDAVAHELTEAFIRGDAAPEAAEAAAPAATA